MTHGRWLFPVALLFMAASQALPAETAKDADMSPPAAGPVEAAALVDSVLDQEAALAALRREVIGNAERERSLRLDLATRREDISRLLAALQAVGRLPPAEGLHPGGPMAAARAGTIIRQLTAALRDEAADLAASLAELQAARSRHGEKMAALAAGLTALDAARNDLRRSLAPEGDLPERDAAAAALARDSDTLTELAAALADGGEAAAGDPARKALARPVTGQVVLGYEERDAAGVRRPGVVIAAPPRALVTAPVDGSVRYAGPFLDYGYVVVLAPESGTLVVLAGLAELFTGAGAEVRRGDALGMLGGRTPGPDEYLLLTEAGTGAGAEETLYVEIRHGTGPVDPGPWFTGGNG